MRKLAHTTRLAFVTVLVAALATPVFAQFPRASRAVYVGTALNVSTGAANRAAEEASVAGRSAATPVGALGSGAAGNEPLILDLTFYDDGFAYGRLLLPRRGLVVAGTGSLRQGTELRLTFDELGATSSAWQIDLAHNAATTGDPEARSTSAADGSTLVATFSGHRDMEFGSEGRVIKGALAFAAEPGSVINAELQRFAQFSTWEFGQGRIHAAYTSPRLKRGSEMISGWLEQAGKGRLEQFVDEGRKFAADGMLGWAWELEEYVTIEGLAGSYLSMLNSIYTYTGGAHPNTFYESYLFELRPSGATVLTVDDLFRPDSSWLARLTPLILAELARQEAAWVTQGQVTALSAVDLATFTLGPAGLTFHFAPYAMGPYVQGAFRVTVAYGQLVGLAPAGGALDQFARGLAAR